MIVDTADKHLRNPLARHIFIIFIFSLLQRAKIQYSDDDNNNNENNHNKNKNNNERHTIIYNIMLWISYLYHHTLMLSIDLLPLTCRACEVKPKELKMIDHIEINY